jgi:hypothetical protein
MPETARIGIGLGFFFALTFCAAEPANCQDQASRVESNTFISSDNPDIRVSVDRKFKYIGSLPFAIEKVARGNRYIFVQTNPEKHIQRMYIIQQEGILPSSDEIYRYEITTPAKLGNSDYQHSVIMYDNVARIREEPGTEADLTQRFLTLHGYVLEPELVMSRFARPADLERKHEIIFFCYENLSSYGHKLKDFREGLDSPEKQDIQQKVDGNCRSAFRLNH